MSKLQSSRLRRGNRQMKKTFKLFGMLLLVVGMIAGCNGDAAQSDSSGTKIFLTLNAMDDFRQTLVDSATEKANENGVQLDVGDANNSIENQVQMMKEAAENGYDVILCGAVSIDTVVELKSCVGDVPIVFFNTCPKEKALEKGRYVYVGSDEEVAGQLQAEYVLEKFADKEEINVAIIKGPKGHSATEGRTKGAKKAFKNSGKKVNYVFEDYANWDGQQAKDLFNLFLKTGQSIDCVICNNDSMALGIVEACKENNIDLSQLPVLGVDATADGCSSIQNNEMAFTVYQSGKGQGSKAIEMAIELANGSDGENLEGITEDGLYVWVPFEKVDSSNVSEYIK